MVSFIVEHGEGDDEEDKNSIKDVNGEPEVFHGEREVTSAVINRVATGLPVGHVSGEHENGNSGDGESKNDDEFGEVGLVNVIRVLIVHKKVHVEEKHDHAHHDRYDH